MNGSGSVNWQRNSQTRNHSKEEMMPSPEVKCSFSKMVPVSELIPNERNPNKHPEKQLELLQKVIERQGWRAPITVSTRSGFIVRGHGKYLTAVRANWEEAPVDYQDYASDEEEKADMIADNRLAELSELSVTLLTELMNEIGMLDAELIQVTGFTDEDIDRMLKDIPPMSLDGIGDVQEETIRVEITFKPFIWAEQRKKIIDYLEVLTGQFNSRDVSLKVTE